MHVFVVQLNADDGPAVPIELALHLPADFSIQPPHIGQEFRMGGAHLKWLAVQPVGQAAVAHFAMVEGPHP